MQLDYKYDKLYVLGTEEKMANNFIGGDTIMKIMFICTGNICRSAMAEWYMKKRVQEEKLDVEVYSSGIYGEEGSGASYLAKEVMSEYGVNMEEHVASVTSKSNIEDMDLILCATMSHKHLLLQMYPNLKEKIFTIKEYAYGEECDNKDISDPWGYDITVYRHCAEEITRAIEEILLKKHLTKCKKDI